MHVVAVVDLGRRGRGVVTRTPIRTGQEVFRGYPDTCRAVQGSQASRYAIQIGEGTFWDPVDMTAPENFVNHSCDPNCYMDWSGMHFKAKRDIGAGEELTFDYLTCSYDLESSGYAFDCNCGSRNCRRRISGFKYLSPPEKEQLRQFLSPFLLTKLEVAAGH